VPPPPEEEEPPHADRKIKPEKSTHPSRKPKSFFLLEVSPVPSSASPPIGSNIANMMPRDCGVTDAVVAAVVLTVNVEVPAPFVTAAVLNAQVAGRVTTGVIPHVRFTVPLKPFRAATVIVEVDDAPAATEAGVSAVPARVKSAAAAAVTVKLTVVL